MSARSLPRTATSVVALTALVAAAALSVEPTSARGRAPETGRLFVVQAVPGTAYTVSVDGEKKTDTVEVGAVLGPFELDAGEHSVRFEPDGSRPMTATVEVRGGSSADLVLHLPAEVGGAPVADVYRVSAEPLSPDTARVLVAHTATVPPADVRVDGQVVFEDIANGEFAVADVPAGDHSAALLPAGTTSDPILGPVDVDLPGGTATMVYAVGSPTGGSMNVISHRLPVRTRSAGDLRAIRTGSAGLVRRVVPFGD